MSNSDIMTRWIKIMMPNVDDVSKKNVLILDSFRGHLTQEIGEACQSKNILRAVIPGGLTSKLQPLDLTVNKSFKSKLKTVYRRLIPKLNETKVTNEQRIDMFTRALKEAWWTGVKKETIEKGFEVMNRRRHVV